MPDASEDNQVAQLAAGATLALENAESLYREATVLFAAAAYSRALFLHQISLEECGKIEILGGWASSVLMGHRFDPKRVESALASHKAKNFANAYMLPAGDAERSAREAADWAGAMSVFRQQQSEFHSESNDRKNAALYVDLVDGSFLAPAGRISADMCQELAGSNAAFLDLVRPKVVMLNRWARDPDSARRTHADFQARLEQLREQHPTDPQRALEVVLEQMLAEAKKERANQSKGSLGDA